MKTAIWIGVFVGGTAGAAIPYIWGNYNPLSISSLLLGALGGVIGIFVGFKVGKYFGL